MNISICYEDQDLLLVNKPQGLATTPGRLDNLCQILFSKYPELLTVNGYHPNEGGLLNRLDNETGGIVFFAKNETAFLYYSQLMKQEKISKFYTALSEGILPYQEGSINFPIAHHLKNAQKMAIADSRKRYRGKPQDALTFYKVLKTYQNQSLLEIQIQKGVRHQIRIHLMALGHPIVNDRIYGKASYPKYKYHCLIAHRVQFISNTGETIDLSVPVIFS